MSNSAINLIEFASDAALVIDTSGQVVTWNAAAERLLGYDSEEVIGRSCDEVLQATLPGGERLCHPDCNVFKCLCDYHPCGMSDCRLVHRDGHCVTADIASMTIPEAIRSVYGRNLAAIILLHPQAEPGPRQNDQLQVYTLGGFSLSSANHGIDTRRWKRKQAVRLLKYLVTQLGKQVHFERLIDCLWPDADEIHGRERLKVTMYCLRRELRANGASDDIIKTVGNSYLLRGDAVWLDSIAFEKFIEDGRALQEKEDWLNAAIVYGKAERLYRGDFMEEEIYTEWCAEERERLRELYLDALGERAECFARLEQYTEAVNTCRKALAQEPCRENLHYALMLYLVRDQRPDLALMQYDRCLHTLARELNVTPTTKTRRLYHQICESTCMVPLNIPQ